jgi:tetratricopeptide (TPR) repeat protein
MMRLVHSAIGIVLLFSAYAPPASEPPLEWPRVDRPVEKARKERLARERALAHVARGNYATGRRSYEVAVVEYQQALTIDQSLFPAIEGLGVALQYLGRYSESAKVLERASPPFPYESLLPQHLALAYLALGQKQKAETLLRNHYPAKLVPLIMEQVWRRQIPPPPVNPAE